LNTQPQRGDRHQHLPHPRLTRNPPGTPSPHASASVSGSASVSKVYKG
jgi:hypothetical protein